MLKPFFNISLLLFLTTLVYAQTQTGIASFYANKWEGSYTASGERYTHSKLTAAHKSLPFGTHVRVTNLSNQKTVDVIINDRGPCVKGRILDLSKSAAKKLDFLLQGLVQVKVEVLDADTGKVSNNRCVSDEAAADEKEYYNSHIKRYKPNGFGVHVGSYQVLANRIRLTENPSLSYRRKTTIQVKKMFDSGKKKIPILSL